MGMFTSIPQDTFNDLQLDAGMLLNTFNPDSPAAPADSAIISATTGGISITCVPTYSDWGEDVDNCPNNMKELKHLDGWECKMSTTVIGVTEDTIKLALGAATKTAGTTGSSAKPAKLVPDAKLESSDFTDLWWVGDRADGGLVAVKLINALSTGGFSLQTTKNGKGQLSIELTGHVSLSAQSVMPMEFYVSV